MSWYVYYYIGYKTQEGKIYPYYPFDSFGKLVPVITRSRSFASDLWRSFNRITLDETTEEIKLHFGDENEKGFLGDDKSEAEEKPPWCFWLNVDDLPQGSYIKSGYFLQEDIAEYERCIESGDYFEGFYDVLSPAEYARKMESELKFGIPKPKKDFEGNEFEVHSCGDYSYYAYPDYDSEEYEASRIREAIDMVEYRFDLPKGSKLVVLQTNG